MKSFDTIWTNARIAIIDNDKKIKILEDQLIAVKKGRITAIAAMDHFNHLKAKTVHNTKNKLVTAALIDSHTHLVYGGNRANEFEQRLAGISYAQIAQQGGGINATIKSTREESFEEIYQSSSKRLLSLIKEGVTTIEIKTGYGLNTASEMKILKIIQKLEENFPIHIEKTFLGAHALPLEYKEDANAYIDYVCNEMLDKLYQTNLISSVDAYCEHLAFSVNQVEKIFHKAKKLGLKIKLHADQFSQIGATKLACRYNALSADHLEYCDEASVKMMKENNVVATLLPGAYYFLRETKQPPIDLFRKYQVPMVVATDLNPGTSALTSLQLMLNMSCVIFGLTVNEAFLAVTEHAAQALSLQGSKGKLEVGYDADFCVWDLPHPRNFICSYTPDSLAYSVRLGEIVNV